MVAYSPLGKGLASTGGGGGVGAGRGARVVTAGVAGFRATVRVRGADGFVVRGVEGRDGLARPDKPRR